jgi:hypothetical protein
MYTSSVAEVTKEYILDVLEKDFQLIHGVSSKEAQVVRALAEQYQKTLDFCVDNGIVTEDRLDEITMDPLVCSQYLEMQQALENGNHEAFKRIFDRISEFPDLLCGWFDHYICHLEIKHHLGLIPATRSDYLYTDYLNRENQT